LVDEKIVASSAGRFVASSRAGNEMTAFQRKGRSTMKWLLTQLHHIQRLVAIPQLLTLIVVLDVVAYFGGLLYWYGAVMAAPQTPIWAWLFIPDCPLFGLLGGLGLLMVTAQRFWSPDAQARAQRSLNAVGLIALLLWLSTYLPGLGSGWRQQGAMLAVCGIAFLVSGYFFRQAPAWLLGIFAFGQIKYGIWTVTAWLVFWRNTALVFGAPLFTADSVFMTITHIALIGQGIFLLTYFLPTWQAALASLLWFGVSDFMDYGLGFYPSLPLDFIPLAIMQWSTIAVTLVLTGLYLVLASQRRHTPSKQTRVAGDSLIHPSKV